MNIGFKDYSVSVKTYLCLQILPNVNLCFQYSVIPLNCVAFALLYFPSSKTYILQSISPIYYNQSETFLLAINTTLLSQD